MEKKNIIKDNHNFKMNDCGVVTNPITVWYFMPKNALAWCYWNIIIGQCKNGLWDYGYSLPGGGSPVSIGKYDTHEEASECGINYMTGYFNKGEHSNLINEKTFKKGQNAFSLYTNSRLMKKDNPRINALNKHSVIDTGSNYVQGSLF